MMNTVLLYITTKINRNSEELKKQMKESIEFLNNKMESNHETLKRGQETLEKKSEELKSEIKKDFEIVNNTIENSNETLLRQMKEDGEKNREELRAVSYTHLKQSHNK